jgi:predicted ArsR family transcriptional regulator
VDVSDDVGADAAAVQAVAALEDASRRELYRFIRASTQPVTREQAAAAIGISRKLAAFHLDKLVAAGLLVAAYDRAARTRTLGRAPKAYRPADIQVRISIPERQPAALAELFIDAVLTAGRDETPRGAVLRVAEEHGRALGDEARAAARPGRLGAERALTLAEATLRSRGYEPFRVSPTCVRMRNCPFEPVARHATDLVCGMNHRLMTGLLDGLQAQGVRAVLAPRPAACCVELTSLS